MARVKKNVAIVGANRRGLSLLPIILRDKSTTVSMIADTNKNAMLFKLDEMGYKLSDSLGIRVSDNLEELKTLDGVDIIINALQDHRADEFLDGHEFNDVEKLGLLSARLLWGVKAVTTPEGGQKSDDSALLGSLREIVDAVRLTSDRKELLSVILNIAVDSTHAERGSIMLLSKEDGKLHMELAKGMDEEVVRKIRVELGDGISGKVAKEGKPIMIAGKASGGEFDNLRERRDAKSALCVPLMVGGKVTGVINVSSGASSHAFTDDDLASLTRLSSLAAEVIARSSEYEQMKVDASKFTFWKEMETVMGSKQPIPQRLNVVCKRLASIVSGLTCYIYLYDDNRNKLVLKASNIKDIKHLAPISIVGGEGIEGWVMESKKAAILFDRTMDGVVKRVYLSIPMVAQGAFLGTLTGHIVSSTGLTPSEESFLKDMTALVAEAIYKQKKSEDDATKNSKLMIVDEIGLELISIKSVVKLFSVISAALTELIGAEGAMFRVIDHELGEFKVVSLHGLDDKEIKEFFLPIEKETVREMIRTKEYIVREVSEEASPYIRGVLACPVKVDGKLEAILTLFNKTEEGEFYPGPFAKVDVEIGGRFVLYASKAMTNLKDRIRFKVKKEGAAEAVASFEKKVNEEVNRAARFGKSLVVATIEAGGEFSDEEREHFISQLYSFMSKKTRSFDTVAVLDDDVLGIVYAETDEKVINVLTRILDEAGLERLKGGLYYGFSSYPADGETFVDLYAKASVRSRLSFEKVS